jgi:glycosyltransferase involved in cell wall biosynthesis
MMTLDRMGRGLQVRLSGVLKRVAAAHAERGGRLKVKTGTESSSKPTVYFLTPDYEVASGGIMVIYRHVDILNRAGIDAFVLHQRVGFRCNWFENQTRIRYVQNTLVLRGDLLVVPEISIASVQNLAPGTRYAIFNQNAHLTWKQGNQAARIAYEPSSDLVAVLTVSKHNAAMLQYGFPGADIVHMRLSIDPEVFYPSNGARPKRISYMPRRGNDDAVQVINLLRSRGALKEWEFVPLNGLSHFAVAEEFRQSRIFMAFTRQEGFGLPAAEAMACGCYVVGNHGFGGAEFFHPDFAAPVETGDIVGFANAVEQAVVNDDNESGWCQQRGAAAARYITATYSPPQEAQQVCATYLELLGGGKFKLTEAQNPRNEVLRCQIEVGIHGHQG